MKKLTSALSDIAHSLDFLRLFVVHSGDLVASLVVGLDQLIELRLQRLGVAMLGPLNKQRHCPGDQRRGAMPVKRLPLEELPSNSVAAQNQKGRRSGRQCADFGQRFSKLQCCHACERLRAIRVPAGYVGLQPNSRRQRPPRVNRSRRGKPSSRLPECSSSPRCGDPFIPRGLGFAGTSASSFSYLASRRRCS